MNCEQTLNNLPHLVVKQDAQVADPISEGISRRALLEHLRTCPECQMEYEALWNTANVLENAEAPVPPPELVGNIQQRVRQLHRRRQLAFFANPLAWCFDLLKLELSAKVVNAIALLFYLAASGFVLKLAFFTNPIEPELGLTAMEKTRLRHVKISPSPWAVIKDTETKAEDTHIPQQSIVANRHVPNYFFGTKPDSLSMWHTDTTSYEKQATEASVINYSQDVASEKLTVFWNHIKTELWDYRSGL